MMIYKVSPLKAHSMCNNFSHCPHYSYPRRMAVRTPSRYTTVDYLVDHRYMTGSFKDCVSIKSNMSI